MLHRLLHGHLQDAHPRGSQLRPSPRIDPSRFTEPALKYLALAWRGLKLFYGIAAIVAAAAIVTVMTVSGGGDAKSSAGVAAGPTAVQAQSLVTGALAGDIVYLVSSDKDAEYLMAYGDYANGFPFSAANQAMPPSKVRVVVSGSPADEARVMSMLASELYYGPQPNLKVIDLRRR